MISAPAQPREFRVLNLGGKEWTGLEVRLFG